MTTVSASQLIELSLAILVLGRVFGQGFSITFRILMQFELKVL